MKEQIPQPAPLSRTLQGKTREANTASVTHVLQAYKKDISQRQEIEDDDELLQGKFETTQREELDDDELLQGKFETTQRQEAPNNTGLPDNLKAGVEQLSDLEMSDVKVHYNSSKPASVQAYAYTQGTDIHVAPGQEKHLGHEAWHVAQQKQGRVQPTTTVGGMPVNDNVGLESEADVMGGKAVQMKTEVNSSVGLKKNNVKQGFGFMNNHYGTVFQSKLIVQLENDRKKEKKKMKTKLSPKSKDKPIAELADDEVLEMLQIMGITSTAHGIERIKGKEGRQRLASAGINTTTELFDAMKCASLVKESKDFPRINRNGQPQNFYTIAQGIMYFCINPERKMLVTITYK